MEQEVVKKKRLTRTAWFWVLIAIAVVVVVCAGGVLADWLVYHNEVHAGISVNGVDLGGMTKDQAVTALTQYADRAGGPVTLKDGDKTWSVTPADAGRAADVQGAVAAAMAVSRQGNFFDDVVTRFELYRDHRDLTLTVTIDKAKLDAALGGIAAALHVTPVNAQLVMANGQIQVIQGADGQDVDVAALSSRLGSIFVALHTDTVDIPLIVKKRAVMPADNQPALLQAQTIMSAPITITSHDKTWTLSPEQIASWMDFRTDYRNGVPTPVPYIAEDKVAAFLTSLAPDVNRNPVNARFAAAGGTINIIPAIAGETLDPTATAKAVNDIAANTTGRTVPVVVTTTEPDFTTADAQATTFNDQLSTYSTTYSCPANRQTNVRITTRYATNVFLAPGQEYNFDRQIGPRTSARGYVLAPGITGPNTLDDVLGGGICQVSTTMFNAVFFAGLKVTERHNHSIYINHYPKGRDATVTGGGKNLRFVNDTDHYIWIRGSSNGITTTISIYGTSDGRKVSYAVGNFYNVRPSVGTVTVKDPTLPAGTTKVSKGQTGMQLKTTRLVTAADGSVLHNDTWISTWPMYPTTILVGTK